MSDKITAYFGADVSEVEAKMLVATRATKAYDAAVAGLGEKGSQGLGKITHHLDENERALERIKRKFGAGDVFREVLMGAGIGSGFALAEKAAEMISEYWKKAAESAKKVLEYSQKTTEAVLKNISRKDTDEQKLKRAEKEFADTRRALREAQADPETAAEDIAQLVLANQEAGNKVDEMRDVLAEKEKKRQEKAAEDAKKKAEEEQNLLIENQVRQNEMDNKAAEEKKKAEEKAIEERKKAAEVLLKINSEIEDQQYNRIWKRATLEQKLAQAQKEGRAAQAAYDKDKTAENLLALEKAKTKWLDLKDQIDAAKNSQDKVASSADDLATSGGRTRGADGKLRLRGAIVSDADAARSEATRARNAQLNQEAQRGRIRDSKQVGSTEKGNKTDELLQQIRDSLKPRAIK